MSFEKVLVEFEVPISRPSNAPSRVGCRDFLKLRLDIVVDIVAMPSFVNRIWCAITHIARYNK